jgi:hypothetical protein
MGLAVAQARHGAGSNMRKSLPLLVVAALSVLLSACFTSENPKFPNSSAVAAFGSGGRYVVFEHVGKGKFRKQRTMTVKQTPDGPYEFIGDKTSILISFHDVGNGVIVGQAKPDDNNKHAYGYLFLIRKGNELFFHVPQCDRQDAAVLSTNGVVYRDKWECSIETVADPAKLFAVLTPGDPAYKLTPE